MSKSICVFCGSKEGNRPIYVKTAREFGEFLATKGHTLVYGGASIGVMGAMADAALLKDGKVKGAIPKSIVDMEVAHNSLTEMKVVDSMHERKHQMYEWSDAFVAFPGGMGTLDEYCEIVTWAQLQLHQKPCYLLNLEGFFEGLISHIQHMNSEGFFSDKHMKLVKIVDTVDQLKAELSL